MLACIQKCLSSFLFFPYFFVSSLSLFISLSIFLTLPPLFLLAFPFFTKIVLKLENNIKTNKQQKKTKCLCPKDNKTYTFNETKTQRLPLNLTVRKKSKVENHKQKGWRKRYLIIIIIMVKKGGKNQMEERKRRNVNL